MHQKAVMFNGSVGENLRRAFIFRTRRDRIFDPARAARLLDAIGIPAQLLTREASTLSVGEGARVVLIRTLMVDPQVLLLDEPTAPLTQPPEAQCRACLRSGFPGASEPWLQ